MSRSFHRPLLLVFAALLTVGCSDDPVLPTEPTPDPVTEVFSGTLTVNGAETHTFDAAVSGTATATLTALGPDSGDTVGLGMGTYSGNVCQIILSNTEAVQTTVITGTVGGSGTLCVRIHDVGQLTRPVNYEIQIVHP